METTITLPCTANDIERVLHTVCDHHGCWLTATVTATGNQLKITYEQEKSHNEHQSEDGDQEGR